MPPTDAAVRSALPENMADYVIRNRDRLVKLGRNNTLPGIAPASSWLTIVEYLIEEHGRWPDDPPTRVGEVGGDEHG